MKDPKSGGACDPRDAFVPRRRRRSGDGTLRRNARAIYQRAIDAYVAKLPDDPPRSASRASRSSLSERLAALHRSAEAQRLRSETIADLRCGDVLLRVSAESVEVFSGTVLQFAEELHAAFEHVTLLAAPASIRTRLIAWGATPSAIEHMRRLKARFDPKGLLRPDVSSAASEPAWRDVPLTLSGVFTRPSRLTYLAALGPAGWLSTARFLTRVMPRATAALRTIRREAERIPDDSLRREALAAIDGKAYHVQGGSILGTFLDDAHAQRFIDAVAPLESIYDYLDNLCDRLPGVPPRAYPTLHAALSDALDPRRSLSDYYRDGPHGDDGGYLTGLVESVRTGIAALPNYALTAAYCRRSVALYAELQHLKHLPEGERERACCAWHRENSRSFPARHGGSSPPPAARRCPCSRCCFSLRPIA